MGKTNCGKGVAKRKNTSGKQSKDASQNNSKKCKLTQAASAKTVDLPLESPGQWKVNKTAKATKDTRKVLITEPPIVGTKSQSIDKNNNATRMPEATIQQNKNSN